MIASALLAEQPHQWVFLCVLCVKRKKSDNEPNFFGKAGLFFFKGVIHSCFYYKKPSGKIDEKVLNFFQILGKNVS